MWAAIGFASAVIAIVPFRRLAPLLGQNMGAVMFVPFASDSQVHRARLIGRTIGLAARYAPFRSNCLPQALVGCALCALYRVPYALCFGVRLDGESRKLDAHAWIASGPAIVTGGAPSFHTFSTLACFVAPRIDRL